MSLTATTLAAAIDGKQTEFKVTSAATGFAVDYFLLVDSELMFIRKVDTTSGWIRVERGQAGTLAVEHAILAPAYAGLADDLPPTVPYHVYSYGANANVVVGRGLHKINGAAAVSLSLRAPRYDEDGLVMLFMSTSAYAHAITLTSGGFNGGAETTVRFVGALGDHVELTALGGNWLITSGGYTTYFTFMSPSKSPSASASKSASKSPSVSPSPS